MPNNFLTKEGFQKLQDELDYLRKVKAPGGGQPPA
jgi:hypothetical protein